MRSRMLFAALALGSVATIGFSGDKTPAPAAKTPAKAPFEREREHDRGHEAANKALYAFYGPKAEFHISGGFEINGVHILEATVNRDGAVCEATVTDTGDYITLGIPERPEEMSQGAVDTLQLFKEPVTSITREDLHGYWVTCRSPHVGTYVVQFDASGRIRDIKSPQQLHEDNNPPKAGGPEAHRVAELASKRFGQIQVQSVDVAIHDPGYLEVAFRAPAGQGWVIMNAQDDVTEWRYPITREQVPPAVKIAMERDLHGDRIERVQQGAARLYKITETVGGEPIVLLVKPDGAVQWLNTQELHRHHDLR